jgi:hypothetical protein
VTTVSWPRAQKARGSQVGGLELRPPPGALPGHGHIGPLTCGFSKPLVTVGARRAPPAAARVWTQRVPPVPGRSGRGGRDRGLTGL